MESILAFLTSWNQRNNDRQKLQSVYAVTALACLLLAGLAALINDSVSYVLLQATFLLAFVFLANLVFWALIDSLLVSKLPRRSSTVSRAVNKKSLK